MLRITMQFALTACRVRSIARNAPDLDVPPIGQEIRIESASKGQARMDFMRYCTHRQPIIDKHFPTGLHVVPIRSHRATEPRSASFMSSTLKKPRNCGPGDAKLQAHSVHAQTRFVSRDDTS